MSDVGNGPGPEGDFQMTRDEHVLDLRRTAVVGEAAECVTRVVVVKDGMYKEYWADGWRISIQDAGRTVKFFARGDGSAAIETRAAEFGQLMGVPSEEIKRFTADIAAAEGQPDRFETNK